MFFYEDLHVGLFNTVLSLFRAGTLRVVEFNNVSLATPAGMYFGITKSVMAKSPSL